MIDTSNEYFEMCRHEHIQDLYSGLENFKSKVVVTRVKKSGEFKSIDFEYVGGIYNRKHHLSEKIFIVSVSQWICILSDILYYLDAIEFLDCIHDFSHSVIYDKVESLEQILCRYFMYNFHGMVWEKGEWRFE